MRRAHASIILKKKTKKHEISENFELFGAYKRAFLKKTQTILKKKSFFKTSDNFFLTTLASFLQHQKRRIVAIYFKFTSKSNADIFSDDEMSLVADLINSPDPLEKSIIVWKSKRLKWKQICLKLAEEKLISMDDLEDPKTLERIKRRGNRAAYKIKNLIQEASKVYN